jgi:hypothetical protein
VETTAVSVLRVPHDCRCGRELEIIGTEPLRKSVCQDEDDRGERDDRLISKDAEEPTLRKENAKLKRTNLNGRHKSQQGHRSVLTAKVAVAEMASRI